MGLTPFWSQPLAASRWIAVLVTSMLVSRERVGGCRLLPTWAEEACSMEVAGQICRRSLTGWITLVINWKRNRNKSVFAEHCSLDVKCWSSLSWDDVHGTGLGQMPKELKTEVVRGCFLCLDVNGRLDGHAPPEMMLITSLGCKLHLTQLHYRLQNQTEIKAYAILMLYLIQ